MATLDKRLAERMAAVGMTQASLAKEVGMRQQGIQAILAGKVRRPKKLLEIARAVQTTQEYLLGLSNKPSELIRVPLGQEFPPDPDPDAAGGFTDLTSYKPSTKGGRPEIDVDTGAGEGRVGEGQIIGIGRGDSVTGHRVTAEWVFPEAFLRHGLEATPSGVIFMPVHGDSMTPTLQPGDRVIVDTRQSHFGPDAVYVIDDGDGEPRVKRLVKVTRSKPPKVSVVSDNQVVKPQVVEITALRVLGRVVGKVSRM